MPQQKQFHLLIHAALQMSDLDFSFVFSPVHSDNVTLDAGNMTHVKAKFRLGKKVGDAVKEKIDGTCHLVSTILRWKLYI